MMKTRELQSQDFPHHPPVITDGFVVKHKNVTACLQAASFEGLLCVLAAMFALNSGNVAADDVKPTEADVIIYGGTSAAITAAVQCNQMGKTVVIVSPDRHLGGLSSGGLGFTDSGNKDVVGGLSREFYHRVWMSYQKPESWTHQTKESFGQRSQGRPGTRNDKGTMWVFEPHVAEKIFDDWIDELQIQVIREAKLDRSDLGVEISGDRIKSFKTLDGKQYVGEMFIDTTYEGDLLAAAGVRFHVGREANSTYDEKWNGVQTGVLHHSHFFSQSIDPYIKPGDPSSGLLPRISPNHPGNYGDGDHRIQAYCFRMCLSDHPDNRIPFAKPDGYDPWQYELLARTLPGSSRDTFRKFDRMPNRKTDTNNHGPFSTDNIGRNYDYPNATYQRRAEIIAEHEQYQKGLLYFLATDPRVPEKIRSRMNQWGLAADEFIDNGGWPHQIYVREARRMIGEYVMTEHDCLDAVDTPDSVGMGSYTLDSHNVQRYVKPDGFVQNEGDIGIKTPRPYEIAYGSITPKKSDCVNLLVPVCVSSSHAAFGSIRMEPVFMVLGQSAATAACLSIDQKIAVQDLSYSELREHLLDDDQVLTYTPTYEHSSKAMKGIVLDDSKAKRFGRWVSSKSTRNYVDAGYHHNDKLGSEDNYVVFSTEVDPGQYQLSISNVSSSNRASNAKVIVQSNDSEQVVRVDQRKPSSSNSIWTTLGNFDLGESVSVRIETSDADGYVIVDAIQLLPAK